MLNLTLETSRNNNLSALRHCQRRSTTKSHHFQRTKPANAELFGTLPRVNSENAKTWCRARSATEIKVWSLLPILSMALGNPWQSLAYLEAKSLFAKQLECNDIGCMRYISLHYDRYVLDMLGLVCFCNHTFCETRTQVRSLVW
jgi:hypothetical protein